MITEYRIKYKPNWDIHFSRFDPSIQSQILKKIEQMKKPLPERGLHQTHILIEEAGQYRIAYKKHEDIKHIHFVGNHKQYERWYKSQ
jgi:mRNA-degrading endonuclease RelE of RelBE toxin-antitoxin system